MIRAVVTLVIIVAVIATGLFVTRKLQAANPTEKTQYKLTTVTVDQVKKTVSATGTLKPWRIVDIKSKAGGRVDELLVDVGSVVKRGQVMARIDPSDTLLSVNTAQADIDSARARIQQSKTQYALQQKQSEIAVQTAEASLRAAKASLAAAKTRLENAKITAQAQPDLTTAAIKNAEASLAQAKQQRAALDATNPQQIASAKAALDQAEANLKNTEANLTRQENLLQKGFVSKQVVDAALASRDVARAARDSAATKYRTIEEELKAAVEAADARVAQAQAQLANAKTGRFEDDNRRNAVKEAEAAVKQAQAQVSQAQANLDQAKANRAQNRIRALDIATAEATIARAQATMTNAKITLDQTTVRAPTDGVVLMKYVEEGTIISSALSFAATGNNIIQLGDITRMYVDVTVDETDIANVTDGQEVEVNIEAYPGIPFEGKVARIDPQAEVIQNVTMVHVRVEIDNSVPSYRLLKPGMNANCEFVVQKKDDVIAIPSEAIRTDNQGQFVEIARGGQVYKPTEPGEQPDPNTKVDVVVERRAVEVGLEGNDTTEIVSGLKEGEVIVTQKIEPAPKQAGSPFGGGGMGGFRGGGGGGGRR